MSWQGSKESTQAASSVYIAAMLLLQDPYANSFMPRHMRAEEWTSKQLRGLGARPLPACHGPPVTPVIAPVLH